jgi:hypothetical protein
MTPDRPEGPADRGGSGPLVAMLICFAVLCAGSVGGAGYFAWRAANNAAERAEERRLDEQVPQAPEKARPE